MLRPTRPQLLLALTALLLCTFATCTPTSASASADSDASLNATSNYNCPEDCQCTLAHNTHKPFLHAKCTSLHGLQSEAPLQATLPIHSIDLSYLSLSRLAHSLEKLLDLTSIDLSHNELHEIAHLGKRIKKLNLKHNRITSAKLLKLPLHLQVLNLQHNDITYLPKALTNLSHLHTLELSHNQINCSCETLDVRNWLQERHVFMEHAVTCTYPIEVKGKPWLQVKQSDICEHEKRGWNVSEDENELMMGDQPIEGSGDADDEDELGNAFMPLDTKGATTGKTADYKLDDVEGSGDLSSMNMPLDLGSDAGTPEPPLVLARSGEQSTTEQPLAEDEEDGSGSGGGMLIIPHLTHEIVKTDDFDVDAENKNGDDNDDDDDYDNKPVERPAEATPSADIFGDGMGIFDDQDGDAKTEHPVEETPIVPVVHTNLGIDNTPEEAIDVVTDGPVGANESDAIMHAKVGEHEDSNATYFLLGVIGLIVIGLILYVGIKRCKNKRNGAHDAENPRQTELLDMDKKNLGKPIQRNGKPEHVPLIGEKSKSDLAKPVNGAGKNGYEPSDVKDGAGGQQQPLLNGNGTTNTNGSAPNTEPDATKLQAPSNEHAPHEYHPITPRYPTPKSPRASKYAQYPPAGGEHNNNNDDAYLPSSPKSGRYSPVYSPETGRVKIKLTETPKPKTPMLVTRSKSNAGEIITTPVQQQQPTNQLTVPGVHGGGIHANGNGVAH